MRLSKIKLAGFKSFVDPTTINLPSQLVGIVGPNGCGKSNSIDAVRWVMGESSAKYLRGESMDDVIFNGSSSRKPVVQASIELVFDNSSGRLGGEYASFNEISVRRQVTREGQSNYYLNGSRCRRRDITDIFLGTGLGPRSYAIIEQGTISRLVEAKPQELRVYLEEAAGISKYKERRRETENRIGHTRDNLDRLNDLREEVDKQLRHLKRQANTAERYKTLKDSERRTRAELLLLKLRDLAGDLQTRETKLQTMQTQVEKLLAELRHCEAQIEQLRQQRSSDNEQFNQAQAAYYQVGNEISRLEQAIEHQRDLQKHQQQEHQEATRALEQALSEIKQDEAQLATVQTSIEKIQPQFEEQQAQFEASEEALEEAEQQLADWQRHWDEFQHSFSEPVQQAQVEKTRMEHLERQIGQLEQRRSKLQEEQSRIDPEPVRQAISEQGQQLEEGLIQQEQHQAELAQTETEIRQLKQQLTEHRSQIDERQRESQQLQGRLSALESLQQAALGRDKKTAAQSWLAAEQLDNAARLGEQVDAEPQWARAVETVLGNYLEAVQVDDLSGYLDSLAQIDSGEVLLFESAAQSSAITGETLWQKVKAPAGIQGLLSQVFVADNIRQAMVKRAELQPHQSVITPEGVWLSQHWARLNREHDEHLGVLERKQEIQTLQAQLETVNEILFSLQETQGQVETALHDLENQRQVQQGQANEAHRAYADIKVKHSQFESRLAAMTQRQQAISEDIDSINREIDTEQASLEQATQKRNIAIEAVDAYNIEREQLNLQRDEYQARLNETRSALDRHRTEMHQLGLQLESYRSTEQSTRQNLQRMQDQVARLQQRVEAVSESIAQSDAPVQDLTLTLETFLTQRVEREKALHQARDKLQSIENQLREEEQQRQSNEHALEQQRSEMEQQKLGHQEIRVRHQTLLEQFRETGFDQQVLQDDLDEAADATDWENYLDEVSKKIQRLGPINLAAIEEYENQNERKTYLDSQFEDLTSALDTLEAAIKKIDTETKARFKDTFDRVNSRIQEMFPRLFGGGQAYLELTDDDLLTTGVAVMARPPGKRISTIHLMSGGEKALTAVALVFAIFELNPAPFCMLDEVDAPLDDANVGRFCDLVREMSERVQFIFITHNKVTMELAQQLIGVTMREPGVSRLVDVDIEEAAMMVAQ